jgi:hypothetical protein
MINRAKRIAAITVVGVGMSVLCGTSSAATVVGHSLAPAAVPNANFCLGGGCTAVLTSTSSRAPGGIQPSAPGVITSWRVRTGDLEISSVSVRLRVVRLETGAGSGPVETISWPAGTREFAARLPVEAGDRIGLDVLDFTGDKFVPVVREVEGGHTTSWSPILPDGDSAVPFQGSRRELLINATIEPDADGDGYGDETQDDCPSLANDGGACPPPSAADAPPQPQRTVGLADTRITGGPRGVIRVARGTFRFASVPGGSRLECRLDRRRFKPCTSPRTYRKLGVGTHVFRVRAVSADGAVDPTPAKRTFRVAP